MSPHSSVVSVSRVRYGFTMGFTVRFRNSFIRLFIYGLEVSLYIKIERRGARGAAKAKSKTKRNSNRRGVSARPASAVGSTSTVIVVYALYIVYSIVKRIDRIRYLPRSDQITLRSLTLVLVNTALIKMSWGQKRETSTRNALLLRRSVWENHVTSLDRWPVRQRTWQLHHSTPCGS